MEAAVVADGKGNAREAKFTFPNNTMVHHSCSMTHLGQFYIVGGNMGDHAKQMRKSSSHFALKTDILTQHREL